MTQEQFAENILEIAIGTDDSEARCGMVIDACEAAEKAGLKRETVLATLVMALVTTGTMALTASKAMLDADEPRGAILR